MFELRMEITLQLSFIFTRHCDVFLLRYNYVIYLFDVVTFLDNVRITLYSGTFEINVIITLCLCSPLRYNFITTQWRSLLCHNYVIYLFDVVTFLMTLELRYVLVRSNYILKLRYKMVIFELRLFVTKKWQKHT